METEKKEIEILEKKLCADCKKELTSDELNINQYKNTEKKIVCENCSLEYTTCYDCGGIIYSNDATLCDGNNYCSDCRYNNHFCCSHCGEWVRSDDRNEDNSGNYFCNECRENGEGDFEEESENLDEKNVTMTKKFQSKDFGKIIKHKRGFAVEIECYTPNSYSEHNQFAREEIPEAIGISSDGSLGNLGVEFQTPILKGEKGEKFLKDFCNSLVRRKYYVDKSCGLHLHLDGGKDFTTSTLPNSNQKYKRLDNFKKLFASYYILDDILAMFLPFSRRSNTYCKRLSNDYNLTEVMTASGQSNFEKIWYRCDDLREIDEIKKSKSHNSRYHGVNFHCLLWQNHLEIRYHSGTIDKNKILFWAELNLAIMDYAVSSTYSTNDLKRIQTIAEPKTKRAEMYKLLDLDGEIIGYLEARAKKFCSDELTADKTERQ